MSHIGWRCDCDLLETFRFLTHAGPMHFALNCWVWGHGRYQFQAVGGPPFGLDARWDDGAATRHVQLQRIRCAQHRAGALRGLGPYLHVHQPPSGHLRTFCGHPWLLLQMPRRGAMTTGTGGPEQHRDRRATRPDVYSYVAATTRRRAWRCQSMNTTLKSDLTYYPARATL